MKNTKKLVGIVLAVLMLMTILPVAAFAADGTTVYFDVNSSWTEAGARFAVYYFNDEGNGWVDLVADGDLYKAEIPAGFPSMIICRMNPASEANDWGNKWNQTANLTVPTDDKNCFAIPYGNWDNADDSNWYVKGQQPNNETQEGPVEYYVAGEEALCGVNWKENAAENKMAKNADGVWELVYENVEAGTYQFKVTNGTWAQSWGGDGPGGNYQIEVTAKSNLKILFDGEAIQVVLEEVKEEEEPSVPTTPENPDNGDGVMLVAMVGFIALAGVAMMLNLRKKEIF